MGDHEGRIAPNTFQTFNVYVDRAMQHVTDAELRVLIFATRHTMGWQDHVNDRMACLSITMFVEGFTTREGVTYGGCGLGRPAVSKALNSLEVVGLLERAGYIEQKGQQWRLGAEPNWVALEQRSRESATANLRRTQKASECLKERRIVGRTESNTSTKPRSKPKSFTGSAFGVRGENSGSITTGCWSPDPRTTDAIRTPSPRGPLTFQTEAEEACGQTTS